MRILLTGITGFAGGHLAEALLAREDVQSSASAAEAHWPAEWRTTAGRVDLRPATSTTAPPSRRCCARCSRSRSITWPAMPTSAGRSRKPDAAWAGNLTATRILYEAVIAGAAGRASCYVGSGLVYGDAETPDQVYDEQPLLRPASPYAASKAAADLVSYQYVQASGAGHRPGPAVQPHWAAPVAGFRHRPFRPADRRHRAAAGSRRWWRPAT